MINWDVKRTYVGHGFFQDDSANGGKEALYKISKAYSVYDAEVGYCQGFSFMAAVLLLQVTSKERGRKREREREIEREGGIEEEVIFSGDISVIALLVLYASRLLSYIGIVLHAYVHVAEFFVLSSQ